MKRIYYFILGLVVSPIVLIIAIYSLGKNVSDAMKIGYKKGVNKWKTKQD